MRATPPENLALLLGRTGLATERQLARVARRVRHLTAELPPLESIWLDAVVQARLLTPFQAAEIQAGRGDLLRVGPFALCEPLAWPTFVPAYRARRLGTKQFVRLIVEHAPAPSPLLVLPWTSTEDAVGDATSGRPADGALVRTSDSSEPSEPPAAPDPMLRQLQGLAELGEKLDLDCMAPVTEVGRDGNRLWAASPWTDGRSLDQWLVRLGRFPPRSALKIARAMLTALNVLADMGLEHGDLRAESVVLKHDGRVVLLAPGLRAAIGSHVSDGSNGFPNDSAACGTIWWRLLSGREPNLYRAERDECGHCEPTRLADVRRYAPATPDVLADVIADCLGADPAQSSQVVKASAEKLGASTEDDRRDVARCLRSDEPAAERWMRVVRDVKPPRWSGPRLRRWGGAMVSTGLMLALVGFALSGALRSHRTTASVIKATGSEEALPLKRPVETTGDIPVALTKGSPLDDDTRPVVAPATYQAPLPEAPPNGPLELILDWQRPSNAADIRLHAGQCVRGLPGKRCTIVIPQSGWDVDVDKIRFENVDFTTGTGFPAATKSAVTMIRLRTSQAEFRGCTFSADSTSRYDVTAIDWCDDPSPSVRQWNLPVSQMRWTDCLFERLAAGVRCTRRGTVAIEIKNALSLTAGPLIQLDRALHQEETLRLAISQVTLRESGPLLQYRLGRSAPAGQLEIQADRCVFVPAAPGALLQLLFDGPSKPLAGTLRWTGQGSLLAPTAAFASETLADGVSRTLDDAEIPVAGLVCGRIDFAGPRGDGPSACRATNWQAPLATAEPPGIDPRSLSFTTDEVNNRQPRSR